MAGDDDMPIRWVTDAEFLCYLHALACLRQQVATLPAPSPYWWHWLRWGCEHRQIQTALVVSGLN